MSANKQIQFIQGSAVLIMSNLVIKGINFFLLPLYTKYLTPEMMGVTDSITGFTSMLFPLLVMGLDSAFSAFYFDEKNEFYSKKVFNTILGTLLLASIIPIILAMFSEELAVILFGSKDYTVLVGISLISVSMNLWWLPFSLLARVENKMLIFASVDIIASLSMIFLNVLFLSVIQIDVYSLILSTTIVQGIKFILYSLIFGKKYIRPKTYDKILLKQVLRYSLPLLPNAVAAWVLNVSSRYFILYFYGEGDVGLYGIATRFGTAVSLIANGIYMSYTTYVYSKKDDEDAPKQYSRILNAFVFMILIICITGSIFAKELILLMTESAYRSAYIMIAPILFSQLIYGINTIIGYPMGFSKKSKYILFSTCIGAAINVILNLILMPIYGSVVASYALLASFCVMALVTYIFAQRLYYVDYKMAKMLLFIFIAFGLSILFHNEIFLIKLVLWICYCIVLFVAYKTVVVDYFGVFKRILLRVRKNND